MIQFIRAGHAGRFVRPLAGAALLLACTAPLALADDAEVLARVNGRDITVGEVNLAKEAFAEQLGQVPETAQQNILVDVLIDMHVLADAAEKAGLAGTDLFERRMAFLRNQALRNAFVEEKVQAAITDEELQARYQKDVAGYQAPEEVHARHILVKTDEEAKAIIADLDAGGDFAAIAAEKSLDGSKANGGDLGFFTKGQMVPEFEAAAFDLEAGSYNKVPVKTQFGFHIIKVEEKRTQPVPSFEEVKEQVRQVVSRETFGSVMEQLKAEAEIERLGEADVPQTDVVPPAAPADPAAPAQP
ncbi:peptidylprolyl isomerase [Methylobrevis albus]|uniref:Parvulin-like PPIase n=1 Tax=Methylobrevis albus TaxID=2793297 RepID=A0A931I1S0_9HYPH|nr:peptidylprolyl isomerase [Methylobrevis albus]MBH0237343.1 peptidylprolyl isomerase [Methylobrevis albus]